LSKSVVLFSGGQDSTAILAQALAQTEAVAWALLKAAVEVEGMGGDEWIAVVEGIGR
jgi:PP-loop superfamily ATP-utilizing enzyme